MSAHIRFCHTATMLTLTAALLLVPLGCTGKQPMVSVGGTIVDENDAPVEGVKVSLNYEDNHQRTREAKTVTDPSGKWQVAIPKGLVQVCWQLQHPDFALSTTYSWISVTEELLAGTLRHAISHGIRLRGVVVDEAGAPVADALIVRDFYDIQNLPELRERVRSGGEGSIVLSDAEGRFVMPVDMKTTRMLTFHKENLAPQFLFVDKSEEERRIVMGKGRTWTGLVKDASGTPLQGAKIGSHKWQELPRGQRAIIRYYETQTDAAGAFTLSGLPETGSMEFGIKAEGYFRRETLWSASGENESSITMYSSAPLQGRVLDAVTGNPVKKFTLDYGFSEAAHAVASYWCHELVKVSDRKGAFSRDIGASLDDVPGAIWLRVMSPNYYPGFTDPVNAIEFGTKPLEIRLEPAQPLSGRVCSPDGKSLKGASVALVLRNEKALIQGPAINLQIVGAPYNLTTTGRGGHFSLFPSKEPGLIVALHETGWAVRPVAEHKPEEPLRLSPWCRIEGAVSTEKREPEEKVYINAEALLPEAWEAGDSLEFTLSTQCEASGRFSLGYVPALPIKFGESRRWVRTHAVDITPEPGKTTVADFCAGRTGAVVGKLLSPGTLTPDEEEKEPWYSNRRLFINVRPRGVAPEDKYNNFVPLVQKDGTFTLDCLPPGDYDFKATQHAMPPENACGRGTPFAQVERSFSIAPDQSAPTELGELLFEAIPLPQPGQAAAEIEGVALADDKAWKLSDERGAPVLLVFWTSWCAPCRAEIPLLKTLWQQYGESGRLRMVGLNLDFRIKEARKFLEKEKLPWPQVNIGPWSETNATTLAYGISGIPSVWLIDGNGNILESNIPAETLTSVLERHLP